MLLLNIMDKVIDIPLQRDKCRIPVEQCFVKPDEIVVKLFRGDPDRQDLSGIEKF